MQLSDLLKPWMQNTTINCDINGLHNDSRQIKAGNLFIAYPGAAADGRLFIEKALIAGANAIAYDPENFPQDCVLPKNIPTIAIPQLAQHLGSIANTFYQNPGKNITLTGVTGTNGKTTIAYQLAQAHQLLGQDAAFIGTIGQGPVLQLQNTLNTTPDALFLVQLLNEYKQAGIKQLCMEVSSHALVQHRVDVLQFKQAIFTNLTLDHLDYHHTMEEYAQAKALLFARPELEYAIINQDDPYQKIMTSSLQKQVQRISYGIHNDCDVKALSWNMDVAGTSIEVQSPWGLHQLNIKSLGQFNIYNCLAVFASLLAHGYDSQAVVDLMPQLHAACGRLELVAQNPYVLVDYAHTPDALESVLITLKQIKKGRLWVIFGCGGDRDKSKRPIMGKAASMYADNIVITSDNPRSEDPDLIIEEIAQGIPKSVKAVKLVNREQAIEYALQGADKEDIILIAGKGHEAYQQIGAVKHPFSDQEVVRKIMTKLVRFS